MLGTKVYPVFAIMPSTNMPVLMGITVTLALARKKMKKLQAEYEKKCKARGDEPYWKWAAPNHKVKLTQQMLDQLPGV